MTEPEEIYEELVQYNIINPEDLLNDPDLKRHIKKRDTKGKIGNTLINMLTQTKAYQATFKQLGQSKKYTINEDLNILKTVSKEKTAGKGYWKRISATLGKTISAIRNRYQRLTGKRK